jgi:hypothetical protein
MCHFTFFHPSLNPSNRNCSKSQGYDGNNGYDAANNHNVGKIFTKLDDNWMYKQMALAQHDITSLTIDQSVPPSNY